MWVAITNPYSYRVHYYPTGIKWVTITSPINSYRVHYYPTGIKWVTITSPINNENITSGDNRP